MAFSQPKSSASPSAETGTPVVFTSPSELDSHLQNSDEYEVFVFDGADREVVLRNDCRSYPLRVQATFLEEAAASALSAFSDRCRERYDASFESSIPGAQTGRLPGVASKVGIYAPLDTVELHFYKDAPRGDRRRIIAWLLEA